MRKVAFSAAVVLAGLSAGVAHGQQSDGKSAALKTKLNAASARFHSAQADVERDAYTALIKDTDKQQGKSYFLRDGAGATEMGLLADGPNGKPERIAQFKNGTLEDYNVGIKCFNSYQASGKVDAFLTLGFGGSYTDLERAWEITDKGSETMGGVKVEKTRSGAEGSWRAQQCDACGALAGSGAGCFAEADFLFALGGYFHRDLLEYSAEWEGGYQGVCDQGRGLFEVVPG